MKQAYRMSFCEDIFPEFIKLLRAAKTMRSNQIEASSYQALAETEFDALASEIEDKIQKEKETRK